MKLAKSLLLSVLILFATACVVQADWDPGDGHKMHSPQLPNPNGWDVDVTAGFIADDWKCSWSGPVDDIHFWISAKGDNWGNGIDFIEVAIYSDVAAGDDPDPGITWSHPGDELWFSRVEDQDPTGGNTFTIREPALQGDQGWFDPVEPHYIQQDHVNYWQVNIQDITNPFIQTREQIYWLELHIIPNNVDQGVTPPMFGWKTSLDHWNDDAVYDQLDEDWVEMFDPVTGASLDMAFVITPEPMTIILLAAGLPLLIKRRRRS